MSIYFKRWMTLRGDNSARESLTGTIPPTQRDLFDTPADLKSHDDFVNTFCLVILGGPASGKSTELKQMYAGAPPEQRVFIDLNTVSSATEFDHTLMVPVQQARNSLGVDDRLYVFIDSFDEALLRVGTLADLLISKLSSFPPDKTLLRIACRPTEWLNSLEGVLAGHWREARIEIRSLAPLTYDDVVAACYHKKVDSDAFISDLWRLSAFPLATRCPSDLWEMLDQYKANQSLPKSRWDLHADMCKRHSQDYHVGNPGRPRRTATRLTNAPQRLTLAARLAAFQLLCNRITLWDDSALGQPMVSRRPESLCLTDAAGLPAEPELPVPPTAEMAHEALDTPLFSNLASMNYVFSHRVRAEFLAAYYLQECRQLNLACLLNLLVSPERRQRISPPLRAVAAWLAEVHIGLRDWLLESDPIVLVRAYVPGLPDDVRLNLAKALIDAAARNEFVWHEPRSLPEGVLGYLQCPSLDSVIDPVLRRTGKWGEVSMNARAFALSIAQAAKLTTLQEPIFDIATDTHEPYHLRSLSVASLADFADIEVRRRLKPLLTDDVNEEEELKGFVLRAMFPFVLTFKEVVQYLTPRRRSSFVGAYASFLSSFGFRILEGDIPEAIEWVISTGAQVRGDNSHLRRLDRILLQRAWEYVDRPEVLSRVDNLAIYILKQGRGSVIELGRKQTSDHVELPEQKEARRLLIRRLVGSPKVRSTWDLHSVTALVGNTAESAAIVRHEDAHWLRDLALTEADEQSREIYLALAERADPIAAETPSDSENANVPDSQGESERDVRTPGQEAGRRLADLEKGGDEWGWFAREAMSEHNLSPENLRRLVAAAQACLAVGPQSTKNSRDDRLLLNIVITMHRFFPQFFQAVSAAVWVKWMPLVFDVANQMVVYTSGAGRELLRCAYNHAPSEFVEAVIEKVRLTGTADVVEGIDDETGRSNPVLWSRLLGTADETLPGTGMPILAEETCRQIWRGVLGATHGNEKSRNADLAETMERATTRLVGLLTDSKQRLPAAMDLLWHAEGAGWAQIWPLLQTDTTFADQWLAEMVAGRYLTDQGFFGALTENQICELYQWLAGREQDPKELPSGNEFHSGLHAEDIQHFRASLITHLADRGTREALAVFDRLIECTAGALSADYLRQVRSTADDRYLLQTWKPLEPGELAEFLGDVSKCIVRTSAELNDAIIASLQRLCKGMTGFRLPEDVIDFLWDNDPGQGEHPWSGRPKAEVALSNFLALHLQRDLADRKLIVNREVQVLPSGDRTDIQIDVSERNHPESKITHVIEVKGCWNPELKLNQETQLVEKYLKPKRLRHGLYLVGWYLCDFWGKASPIDKRYKDTEKNFLSLTAARKELDEQSASISRKHMVTVSTIVLDCGRPTREPNPKKTASSKDSKRIQ